MKEDRQSMTDIDGDASAASSGLLMVKNSRNA